MSKKKRNNLLFGIFMFYIIAVVTYLVLIAF